MATDSPRLDWAPHWRAMNDNLVELVSLIPGDKLTWTPREGEWSAQLILTHLILARYHGPIMTPEDMARIGQVPLACKTTDGIKAELRTSWAMVERFLSDSAKLDAAYDGRNGDGSYNEPAEYNGHYIAYHRFAHDLHHRSTVVGFLSEWGVNLDGSRIRPL